MPRKPPTPYAAAAVGETEYLGETYPGIHAYAIIQAMGRVRAYQTAGLAPIGGRGPPQEQLLVGHVHTNAEGKVVSIEGFNGQDGEQFVQHAREVLEKAGLLTEATSVEPTKGLRQCPYTGF